MFTELLPLLADRTLILTIARIDDNLVRVNVVPKSVKDNDPGEKALTRPLSVTGSAADLDRDLAMQLTGFVESAIQTSSNLAHIQEAHKAAVKAVEAENKKTLDSKRKTATPSITNKTEEALPGPVFKDGKPVFGTKGNTASSAPSLFDGVSHVPSTPENSDAAPMSLATTFGPFRQFNLAHPHG